MGIYNFPILNLPSHFLLLAFVTLTLAPDRASTESPATPDQEHTAQLSLEQHQRVPVVVEPAWVQRLSLQTEPVRRETITVPFRAAATVVPAEHLISHVHTRVSGWIQELFVHTTGETVKAGQPLAAIFSQDLYASQIEYLAARGRADAGPRSEVVEGARRRLMVMGMSAAELAEIERESKARFLVTLTAPRDGVVLRRGVSPGAAVDPSTELVTIADLSEVWILAEVSERDIPWVRPGMAAEIDIPASGRAPFEGAVEFVYPTLSERTRSLRLRIPVNNAAHDLRPGMTGTVRLKSMPHAGLTVARDAVVDTGDAQHVFVVTSSNRFAPREVRIGVRSADRIEILEGLQEHEHVLTSGVFLVDSESRLRGSGAAGLGHAGHGGTNSSSPAEAASPAPDSSHQGH